MSLCPLHISTVQLFPWKERSAVKHGHIQLIINREGFTQDLVSLSTDLSLLFVWTPTVRDLPFISDYHWSAECRQRCSLLSCVGFSVSAGKQRTTSTTQSLTFTPAALVWEQPVILFCCMFPHPSLRTSSLDSEEQDCFLFSARSKGQVLWRCSGYCNKLTKIICTPLFALCIYLVLILMDSIYLILHSCIFIWFCCDFWLRHPVCAF